MDQSIQLKYPRALADSLKLYGEDFEREMKESALVKLYELGKISSGVASQVLNIPRTEFYTVLARYKVSIFNSEYSNSIEEDFLNA